MEDLRNESSSTIRAANIRAAVDIIEGFRLPSGATKKIYNDHNRDNPNHRLKSS